MAKNKRKSFSKVTVLQPETNTTLNITENKLESLEDTKLSTEITNNEIIEQIKTFELKEDKENLDKILNIEVIEKLNDYNNLLSQGILCQQENIIQSNNIDENKSKLSLEKELNDDQYIIINEENINELLKEKEENNCIDEKINTTEIKEIKTEEKNISNTEKNIIELNEIKKEENKIEMTEIKIESQETQTSKNKSISCGRKFCSIL
jgi:hypothetical protein